MEEKLAELKARKAKRANAVRNSQNFEDLALTSRRERSIRTSGGDLQSRFRRSTDAGDKRRTSGMSTGAESESAVRSEDNRAALRGRLSVLKAKLGTLK